MGPALELGGDDLRKQLVMAACRAVLYSYKKAHPTLALKPFSEMSNEELRDVIAFHSNTAANHSPAAIRQPPA